MRRQKGQFPFALGNDDPLTRRREKFLRGKNAEGIAIRFGDAHTVKPCLGKKNGIIFPILQLLQTRLNIAANEPTFCPRENLCRALLPTRCPCR